MMSWPDAIESPDMDVAPEPAEEPPRRPQGRGVGLIALVVVVALLGGIAIGRAVTRAHDRAAGVAVAPTAAVLVPDGGVITSSRSGAGVITDITVALANPGSRTLNDVVARWSQQAQTPLGSDEVVSSVGRIAPGAVASATLRVYRPCDDPGAALPTVLVTWTRMGRPEHLTVVPAGLERVWASLQRFCNPGDGPIDALDVELTNYAPQPDRVALFDFVLRNHGSQPLNVATIGLPGFRILQPKRVTVPGLSSVIVELRIRAASCRLALVALYGAGLIYRVGSTTDNAVEPTYTSDFLSKSLGDLASQACSNP